MQNGQDNETNGSGMGARIRALRTARGANRRWLAGKLSISDRTLDRYEADERAIPIQVLTQAAAWLGTNVTWLMSGLGPAPVALDTPLPESVDLPRLALEPSRSPALGTPNDDMRAALVDRIGQAIERAGGGRELAELIGISPRGLGEIAAGARDPTPDQLARLARAAGVDAGWLLTGTGASDVTSIPIYAARPAAGSGSTLEDWIVDWLKLSTAHARALGQPGKLGAMYLRGDSMMPTYQSGRLLFIEQDPMARDEVCLVSVGGELKIKRVQYTADGKVRLLSDNTNYPADEYSPDEARVLGRVVDLKER